MGSKFVIMISIVFFFLLNHNSGLSPHSLHSYPSSSSPSLSLSGRVYIEGGFSSLSENLSTQTLVSSMAHSSLQVCMDSSDWLQVHIYIMQYYIMLSSLSTIHFHMTSDYWIVCICMYECMSHDILPVGDECDDLKRLLIMFAMNSCCVVSSFFF